MEESNLVFNKLFQALYSRPYEISVLSDVIDLATAANNYGCLPALSYSLNAAMLNIKDVKAWYFSINADPTLALAIAKRLRNATLYRDAMIFAVADVKKPAYLRADRDTFPFREAQNAYNRIRVAFRRFCVEFLTDSRDGRLMSNRGDIEPEDVYEHCKGLARDNVTGGVILPKFLRIIFETVWHEDEWSEVLQELLACKLALGVSHDDFNAGDGGFEGMFLCATVEDDELPWNDAVDW